jgi:hypothetical protein
VIILKYRTVFFANLTPMRQEKHHAIKYKYTSILRAQLSDYELLWLFYNGISRNGKLKFKPLIEEYSLLKTIPINHLAHPDHRHLYNAKAMNPG